MRTILLISILCFSHVAYCFEIYVNNKIFYTPEKTSYIECITGFSTKNLKLISVNGGLKGSIQAVIMLKEDASNKIAAFDKYTIHTPILQDKTATQSVIVDLKRFQLPAGKYNFEATYTDANDTSNHHSVTQVITIAPFIESGANFSDGVFMEYVGEMNKKDETFNRSGFEMKPFVLDFYPQTLNKISMYVEAYNLTEILKPENAFLSKFYIENDDTKSKVEGYMRNQKASAQQVNGLLASFDISNLPSGNYNIVVEVLDKKNTFIGKQKLFFQRSNPALSKIENDYSYDLANTQASKAELDLFSELDFKKIEFSLKATSPIMKNEDNGQLQAVLKSKDEETMRKYLVRFWKATNPNNPRGAYDDYMKVVNQVEELYSVGRLHGFDTDRGRVFLKYGAPSFKDIRPNTRDELPYEQWTYYNTGNQNNVIFIFYDRDGIGMFKLIHSTARGEIRNENYRRLLQRQNDNNVDQQSRDDARLDWLNR